MNPPHTRHPLDAILQAAAAAYQDSQVIPHCPSCSRPCCRLDQQALELTWKQLKVIWMIDESRTAFDQRLAAGQGPEEIRAGNGRYYAYQKTCPAYDEAQGTCRVYNQPAKPVGCSDFPVYRDADAVIADLRCEAVDVEALVAELAKAAGPGYRVVREADREFPFLVTLLLRKQKAKGKQWHAG